MKRILQIKKLCKKLIFIGLAIYISFVFINQQKTLNSYKSEQQYYAKQIEEQNKYQESLINMKENVNSPEYIEQIAREKLDMYLPNERVYIDINK